MTNASLAVEIRIALNSLDRPTGILLPRKKSNLQAMLHELRVEQRSVGGILKDGK